MSKDDLRCGAGAAVSPAQEATPSASHTPGPWVADDGDRGLWAIGQQHNGGIVATLFDSDFKENIAADARLIAAAPDLLMAADYARLVFRRAHVSAAQKAEAVRLLTAAITKAGV